MLIRRIASTLLFIFALIFALIFFLLNGIKINSFSFGQIYISQLYIKLDKKLIVEIEEIKLTSNSKVKSSYEDLEVNIKRIPTILKFFNKIDIESLFIDGNSFKILFDDDYLYLDNKFVNIASKYNKVGNTITLDLYSLLLKDVNLLLRGTVNLDYENSKASFYGNYIFQNLIDGDLNTQFSKENIDFFLTTHKVKNIKFLKQFFRLDKVAESWMYDNVTGDMQLNYLYGQLNPTTFEPMLNSIKGEAVIKNAQIHFNKKVAPVKTSNLLITYKNDTLKFNLHKPKYKTLNINGSSVEIPNLTSKEKGRVDVLIQTKEVLGNDILDILKAYDISLPIKQLSGKTNAQVLLKIPYVKPMQTFGNFELKDSELLINNNFPFYSKYANVELKNSKVIVKSSHFKHEKLVDATIDLTIDTKTLKAKGNALINEFIIKNSDKEIVNFSKVKTPISMDFNKISTIKIHNIKTKIVLNKENTEVNIDNLQKLSKYSDMLRENNIKQGNLNLYIKDENNITFDGEVKNLDLPIKEDEKQITSFEIKGKLKDGNISIHSKKRDLLIDMKKNEDLKITLVGMKIYPEMETKNTLNKKLNIRLLESVIYVEDNTFYPQDVEVVLDKNRVTFDGVFNKLEIPISVANKKVTSLDIKGNILDGKVEIESKNKKLYFQSLKGNDYFIKLEGFDLHYNTQDKTDSTKNVHIIGKDSTIIINGKYNAISSKYDFRTNERMTRFELLHNKTKMSYLKDEEGLITMKVSDVSDIFINSLFQKNFVKGGTLNIEATGKDHIMTGRVTFKENKIKNLRTLNNLIILVETSPALVNPFLAIPSIFGMVTNDGFNVNGYKINEGYVDLTYNSQSKFLNMYNINTIGNTVDFDGFATFDFEKDIVDSDVKLIFMKGYSSVIDVIPGLDYILLGDDKVVSTQVNIRGSIDDPEITTNILKDSASAPFDLIKRIFTLPLKPFLD